MELDMGRIAGITRFLDAISEKVRNGSAVRDDEGYYVPTRRALAMVLCPMGFVFISSGAYRAAFTHPTVPGVIFKIETEHRSNDMAYDEFYFYNEEATPADRAKIAACYHYSQYVSVMEFIPGVVANTVADYELGEDCPRYVACAKWRKHNRRHVQYYADVGGHNLMICPDGRIILFDYAING